MGKEKNEGGKSGARAMGLYRVVGDVENHYILTVELSSGNVPFAETIGGNISISMINAVECLTQVNLNKRRIVPDEVRARHSEVEKRVSELRHVGDHREAARINDEYNNNNSAKITIDFGLEKAFCIIEYFMKSNKGVIPYRGDNLERVRSYSLKKVF